MFAVACRCLTVDDTTLAKISSLDRLSFSSCMQHSTTLSLFRNAKQLWLRISETSSLSHSPLHLRRILKAGGRCYLEEFATTSTDTDNSTYSAVYSPDTPTPHATVFHHSLILIPSLSTH
jgi:hypothetical protein